MKRGYAANVPLYFIYAFLTNLVFQRGIFLLYLADVGFSNSEIGTLQSALFAANFLLEVPTGLLGDRIGRKWSVFAGVLLMTINALGMVLFPARFGLFLALFVATGAAFAFISGSNTALLYESLKALGRTGEYTAILGRVQAVAAATLGCAILVGGLLQRVSWNLVYLACASSMALGSLVALLWHERVEDYRPARAAVAPDRGFAGASDTGTKSGLLGFLCSPIGRHLASFSIAYAVFEGMTTPYFIYGQKLFDFYGLGPFWVGFIYSAIQFSSGLVYVLAKRVSDLMSLKRLCQLVVLCVAALATLNLVPVFPLTLGVFFAICVVPEVMYILSDAYIQDYVPSELRASLLSVHSLTQSVGISAMYLVWGWALDALPINRGFALMSILPLVSWAIFAYHFRTAPEASLSPIQARQADDLPTLERRD